ncbi:MAG: DEAD/DEAH box helicase [Verrucomicrobiales bacterium]|nr:DEAD/DEAH box helicase [Verrucomicrobiota bacterium JB025]
MSDGFKELGVPQALCKGLAELGIERPTQIQEKVIPFLMENGGDLIAQAQTGTGKTAAFGLPMLTRMDAKSPVVQGLIIAPTRELAKQIGKHLFRYTKYSEKVFVEVISGGEDVQKQEARMRRPTQIVVGTPGRILELVRRKALSLDGVRHLVLDEADEMLSMGFKEELRKILRLCQARKSTWLFSATFPSAIEELIKGCMSAGAKRVTVDKAHVVNRDIDHQYVICERGDKLEYVTRFLQKRGAERGLIFCRTKAGVISLGRQLTKAGLAVDVLHGDLTQKERDKAMRAFKKERVQFMISTDVAARGIDVEGLAFVLQHQLPDQLEYYTHRSGRTARAGRKGVSLTLIDKRELKKVRSMEQELGVRFREVG